MRGGGRLVGGSGGLGRDQVPHVEVDVVEGLVVVVGVVRRHMPNTGGDAPHCLDVRLWGRPASRPSPCALPFPFCPRAPPCLTLGAYITFPPPASRPPPGPYTLARAHSLRVAVRPVSRVPTSVTHALARSPDARVSAVSLPVSFAVPPLAAGALARLVRPTAVRLGALPVSLCLSPGAAARVRVFLVPLLLPCAVPCVPPPAARALACSVCLPSPAAARLGALPVALPLSLPCAPWPVPCFRPWALLLLPSTPLSAPPVAGNLPRPCAAAPLLNHAPGIPLPQQLRQPDDRRRTLERQGADGLWPPLGEGGLWGVRLGGAGASVAGLGVGAVIGALPASRCGCGGSRRGARGLPGAHPPRQRRAGGRGEAVQGRGLSSVRIRGLPLGRGGRGRATKAPDHDPVSS